ncbi:MAG: hypothetical protein Q9162_005352 [Coniocarpon cinnabarinum]
MDCFDASFRPTLHGMRNTHLAKLVLTNLEQGAAKAISYAWGEFDRQKRFLGHFEHGKEMRMELGIEWSLPDLQKTFIGLCEGDGDLQDESNITPLWIDQICIDQDNTEEVRSTLNDIPHIYSTFELRVLLPGAACKCFWDAPSNGKYGHVARWELHGCTNLLAVWSWSTRLWTRQELMYARRVQVVWNEPTTKECTKTSDLPNLFRGSASYLDRSRPLVAQFWLQKLHAQGQDPDDTFAYGKDPLSAEYFETDLDRRLSMKTLGIVRNVDETVRKWHDKHHVTMQHHMSRREDKVLKLFSMFICGETLTARTWNRRVPSMLERTWELKIVAVWVFMFDLKDLLVQERYATKPADYVLSVWVDCPDYEVPHQFRQMTMASLLENALHQLRYNHGMALTACLPAACFRQSDAPLLWEPRHYLEESEVRSIADVYRACSPAHAMQSAMIIGFAVEFYASPEILSNFINALDGEQAFVFLWDVCASWDLALSNHTFLSGRTHAMTSQSRELRFLSLLWAHVTNVEGICEYSPSEVYQSMVNMFGEIPDCKTWAFNLTCTALGIRPSVAQRKGLKLMVPMLGLTRFDLEKHPNLGRDTFRVDLYDNGGCSCHVEQEANLTLCTSFVHFHAWI